MRIAILCVFLLLGVSSCGIFGGGKSKKGQTSEQQSGKKKKPKRCKLESCHVRMVHMHEGGEYLGKKTWFLQPLFYSNKNPKYGEGLKKQKRDPHQWKNRRK